MYPVTADASLYSDFLSFPKAALMSVVSKTKFSDTLSAVLPRGRGQTRCAGFILFTVFCFRH